MKRFKLTFRAAVFAALLALCLTGQTKKQAHAFIDKAALVDFVTPGLVITINSAAIAANGTITVVYSLADPNGLPLDSTGAVTPGPISVSFVAATIPAGQQDYTAYTTTTATGTVIASTQQPGADSGGNS